MGINTMSPGRLDHDVTGEPIKAGQWSVQPVAKLTGKVWRGGGEAGSVGASVVKLQPVEAIVRDAHGGEKRLAITDPTAEALAGMRTAGMAVAAVSIVVCAIAVVIRLLPKGHGAASDATTDASSAGTTDGQPEELAEQAAGVPVS